MSLPTEKAVKGHLSRDKRSPLVWQSVTFHVANHDLSQSFSYGLYSEGSPFTLFPTIWQNISRFAFASKVAESEAIFTIMINRTLENSL